jgi:hypothetical protein
MERPVAWRQLGFWNANCIEYSLNFQVQNQL